MNRVFFAFAAAVLVAPIFARANDDAIVKSYLNAAQQSALARAALKSHGIAPRSAAGPEVDLRIVFPVGQTGLDNLETADLIPVSGGAHQAEGLVIQHGSSTVGVTFQTFKDVRPGATYDVVVNDAAHDSYRVGRITVGSANPQTFTIHAPLLGPSSPTYRKPVASAAQTAGNVLQPWMMGFVGITITPALLRAAGVPDSDLRGVVLSSIVSGSAAQRTGLRAGDVILVCNGTRVVSMPQLLGLTENRRSGTPTTLLFFRGGSLWHAVVPVASGSESWRAPAIGPGYVRPAVGPGYVRPTSGPR